MGKVTGFLEIDRRYAPASYRAYHILDNWEHDLPKFRKGMPVEHRRALADLEKAWRTSEGATFGVTQL